VRVGPNQAPQQDPEGRYSGRLPLGYVEVTVEFAQRRTFSVIWGSDTLPVRARAVARGQWAAVQNGILLLDLRARAALTGHGGGTVTVTGAKVIVDSNDPQAAVVAGTPAFLAAPAFDITGGYTTTGASSFLGTISTGVPPTPDPLRDLPPPDPLTLPLG